MGGWLTAYWCNLQNKPYVPRNQREWFRPNFITLRRSLSTAQHKRTSLLNSESSCFIYLYFITFLTMETFTDFNQCVNSRIKPALCVQQRKKPSRYSRDCSANLIC